MALVAGLQIPSFSFNMLMVGIPWIKCFGPMGWTVSAVMLFLQQEYRYLPELTDNSSRSIGLLTDGTLEPLENIISMQACNSLVSLKFGVLFYPIFPMLSFQLHTEDGVGLR